MQSKILKIFTTVFISALLVTAIYKVIQACSFGEWDDCDLANYSFFDPEIINQPLVTPFFVTCHSLYSSNGDYYAMENLNASEWATYLNSKLDSNDIRIIFSMDQVDFDSIVNYCNKLSTVYPQLKEYSELSAKLVALNNKSVIDYFQFSKKIEQLMNRNSYWAYRNKDVDTAVYVTAIATAKTEIKNSSSSFLKARYAFQVQRMLFYLNRYNECAKWYTENLKLMKPGGSIAYRSLAYYAGCLYHQKYYDQSNYLFSVIYDQFPVMKEAAFTSFHPWEDADWNSTLSMAKTPHEKEVLWQLFGVYADPLKGMKEIYAINPKSNMIDLLLTRAINICERQQLPNTNFEDYNYNDDDSNNDTTSARSIFDSSNSFAAFNNNAAKDELEVFIKNVADKNNTHDPCLWLNAFAYLSWMNKKYKAAEEYLTQLKNCKDLSELNKSQMAITALLIKFGKIDNLNPQTEQQLYELLSQVVDKNPNDKSEKVYSYITGLLAERYKSQGNILMAELCSNNGKEYYRQEIQYDEMLAFMWKTNHTPYESFLLSRYRVKPKDIVEYKAVHELLAYRFDSAIKWFEKDTNSGSAELYGNPFDIHITDCHDCDHAAPQKTKYSKYSFTVKLRALLNNAETSKDNNEKAQNYFLLANGLYNLTYYGNARMVAVCFYFVPEDWNNYNPTDGYLSGNCERAMLYYQKALSYATKKEFKAKCAWMCAKCELNNWYATKEYREGKTVFPDGEYYKMMQEKFSNTKYYSEVINECGYFCSYAGGGNECIRNKE